MRRYLSLLTLVFGLPLTATADQLPGYAIVVSEATLADPAWKQVKKNRMVRKNAGGEAEEVSGPDDATAALATRLSDGLTDLFVTSGHATERDWQIGYAYKNGKFRSKAGKLTGVDTQGTKIPIQSDNPKIWLPVGNCLAGHIDEIIAGEQWRPVVTDAFVLVPLPPADQAEPVKIVFRGRSAGP